MLWIMRQIATVGATLGRSFGGEVVDNFAALTLRENALDKTHDAAYNTDDLPERPGSRRI